MEAIYFPDLEKNSNIVIIEDTETKHIKALRLKPGNSVYITNGKGLLAETHILEFKNSTCRLEIKNIFESYNELSYSLGLAVGILDSRERFEYALEKAVELGISDFYPLVSEFSQKKNVNLQRLNSKAIAAMKQSIRSKLTLIHKQVSILDLIGISYKYEKIIIADIEGEMPLMDKSYSSVLAVVGPEGGFSTKEKDLLNRLDKCSLWNLGDRRLRAETAAVVLLGLIQKMNF